MHRPVLLLSIGLLGCGSDRTPAPPRAPTATAVAEPPGAPSPGGTPLAPGERLLDAAATATWQRADGAVDVALVVKAPEPGTIRCCGEHVVLRTRQDGVVAEATIAAALATDGAYTVTVDVVDEATLLTIATDTDGGYYNLDAWQRPERRLGPVRAESNVFPSRVPAPPWVTAACERGCRRLLEVERWW